MRPSRCLVTVAVSSLLSVACSPALAQTKVAAPEVLSSPKITIAALKPPAADDTTPLSPDLASVATPTLDLARYALSKGPVSLGCASGASESKDVTDAGWEVFCARGGEKHGPYRSFDRKALREVRATYDSGKLSGLHVEVKMTPALSEQSADRPAHSLVLEQARRTLEAGWPFVALTDPVCPAGTILQKSEWSTACILPGGVQHGPSWFIGTGSIGFGLMKTGVDESGRATLDDRRTARESLYEKGQLVRALEHSLGGLSYLEVHKGDETAMLYFRADGHQLTRLRKGKLHGAQLRWDQEGRLSHKQSYKDGVEDGEGATWQSGSLTEVRSLANEKGVTETYSGNSRRRCQVSAGRPSLCETVQDDRLIAREVFEGGVRRATVNFSVNGTKVYEERLSETGSPLERRQWSEAGRPTYQAICNEKTCTTTLWDNAGVATTKTDPVAAPSPPAPDPFVGQINAIRDLVGGGATKPANKVAVP